MISKRNVYLILFLLLLISSLIFICIIKEFFFFYGAFYISIIGMFFPIFYSIIYLNNITCENKYWLMIFTISPLLIISNIFIYNSVRPVGFSDSFSHIFAYNQIFTDNGHIEYLPNVSFNYVGLYVMSKELVQVTGLSIIDISVVLPMIVLFITFILIYIIIKKIFDKRIALLGTIFYGTDYSILLFGHEYRTQTYGMIFILIVIYIIYLNIFIMDRKLSSTPLLIILLVAICAATIAGFTPSVFLFVVLFCIIIYLYIIKYNFKIDNVLKTNIKLLFILFIIIFLSYVIFISEGFFDVIKTISDLSNEMWSSQIGSGKGFGGTIYGDFIEYGMNTIRFVLLISTLLLLINSIINKKISTILFILIFSSILLFSLISGILGVGLSVSRAYSVGFILLGAAMAWFFLNMINNIYKNRIRNSFIKLLLVTLIFFIIFINMTSFPQYLIGNTEPLRGEESIDRIPYWKTDDQQYAVCAYLDNSESELEAHTYIKNHILLTIIDNNSHNNPNNQIMILLHDKSGNENYTYRSNYPSNWDYHDYNRLYSNIDYLIYYNG